jgi:hypothetical protein
MHTYLKLHEKIAHPLPVYAVSHPGSEKISSPPPAACPRAAFGRVYTRSQRVPRNDFSKPFPIR